MSTIIGRHSGSGYDASNPFSRSFMILSLGLLEDDRSQSCTLAMLTVWVTLGLLASTSNWLAAPGAQSCPRNTPIARTTASYSDSACTFTECRMPSGLANETVQARSGT